MKQLDSSSFLSLTCNQLTNDSYRVEYKKRSSSMLFHMIQHDRSGNESFAAQCARIRTFSGVISPMNGKRGCLCKRLPTHGTKIRPLSRVNTLMHDVILAMCETFAAYVAHERPGPMHSFVGSQRLDARELFRA